MDVTGNWWGTNSPGAAQLYGPATYTPTIVLSLSANPATVLAPGATTLQATLQGGGYRVPDGTRLDWSSTFGALGAAWSVTTAGAAQTMLSAAGAGTAAVSVTEPCGFVVTTTVSFMAPTPSATASPTGTRTATPNAQPPTGTPTRTPTPPATPTPTASPSACVAAYVEAEAACAPGATSRPATAACSGCAYAAVPDGSGYGDADGTALTITFNVAAAGTYHFWARASAPDWNGDSQWAALDGGAAFLWDLAYETQGWQWDRIRNADTGQSLAASLSAGSHTLRISNCEDGVQLDVFALTTDAACTPTGAGCGSPAATATATPSATAASTTVILQQGVGGYAGNRATWFDMSGAGYNGSSELSVRAEDQHKALVYFDVSSIPAGATVQSATLALYSLGKTNANSLEVGAHQVLRAWTDRQATWSYRQAGVSWGVAGMGGGDDYAATPAGRRGAAGRRRGLGQPERDGAGAELAGRAGAKLRRGAAPTDSRRHGRRQLLQREFRRQLHHGRLAAQADDHLHAVGRLTQPGLLSGGCAPDY